MYVKLRLGFKQWMAALPYLALGLIGTSVFVIYPMIKNIFISFQDYSIMPGAENPWVGLDNYRFAFEDPNRKFLTAIKNTLLNVAVTVPINWFLAVVFRGADQHAFRQVQDRVSHDLLLADHHVMDCRRIFVSLYVCGGRARAHQLYFVSAARPDRTADQLAFSLLVGDVRHLAVPHLEDGRLGNCHLFGRAARYTERPV